VRLVLYPTHFSLKIVFYFTFTHYLDVDPLITATLRLVTPSVCATPSKCTTSVSFIDGIITGIDVGIGLGGLLQATTNRRGLRPASHMRIVVADSEFDASRDFVSVPSDKVDNVTFYFL
jgi:hypothetical protein